jgi:hypothetical protein
MARAFHESDAGVIAKCHSQVSKAAQKYLKTYVKEWSRCYAADAAASVCDAGRRNAKIAKADAQLRERVGGLKDKRCAGVNLTPITLGHGPVCSAPCLEQTLYDMGDVADCAVCTAAGLGGDALAAAYGTAPPILPGDGPSGDAGKCQRSLAKGSTKLALSWTKELSRCEDDNKTGRNVPALDCSTDPSGRIQSAIDKAQSQIAACSDFTGVPGCGTSGSVAAAQVCVETAVGDAVPSVVEVAYP